jgi:two-component system OmpR family sensor kinase
VNELHPLLATLVEEFLNQRNTVRDATSVPLDVTKIELSQNTKHLLLQVNAHLTYDHFVSSVLEHELRTPLAGIVSTVQLLQTQLEANEEELPDTLQNWCDRLEKLSARMEFLLENMKQLHKNDYSSQSVGRQTRKLTNWFINERKSLAELIKSSQILDLEFQMLDESFEYTTDYHLLSIILGTLVENASKYSPDYARIDIFLEQSQEILRVKVIDNGVGLGGNSSENLIKAFQRGQEVEHIEGSGLGLSIAHAAAQRIQAQLLLYDNENVAGTTAELILSNNGICQKTLF